MDLPLWCFLLTSKGTLWAEQSPIQWVTDAVSDLLSLSLCLPVCMWVCMSACLSPCVRLCVLHSVCMSVTVRLPVCVFVWSDLSAIVHHADNRRLTTGL